MATGTLTIKVLTVNPVHTVEVNESVNFAISIKVGSQLKRTKNFHSKHPMDQVLTFELDEAKITDDVIIESHLDHTKTKKEEQKAAAHWKVPLSHFLGSNDTEIKNLTKTNGYTVKIESQWTGETITTKTIEEGSDLAKQIDAAVSAASTDLSLHETHRPYFLRVSYYYDTTKTVYNYTTSFKVVAPVARFGENTANTILTKVTGKTLSDLEGQLVVPSLDKIDNTADAIVSAVVVKLVQGQNLVIKAKDSAVSTASSVVGSTVSTVSKATHYTAEKVTDATHYTVEKVSNATHYTVGKVSDATHYTVEKVTDATHYTTETVKSVASSTYTTAANVTEYTATQVSNVSSSAYGKVRGATLYSVSLVPYLGAKIKA